MKSLARTGDRSIITQSIAILIGYVGAVILTKVNYQVLAKRWYLVAAVCVGLIIYTLLFEKSVKGANGVDAKAWIHLIGGITFQPSELAKVGFMITFAKHLSYLDENDLKKDFKHVIFLALHAMIPIALTHLQSDDGAGMIFFFMFITMAFAAGIQLRYFLTSLLLVVVLAPLAWKFVLKDYQKMRLLIQFDLESDPWGAGYQQIQGMISIASGKIFGRGLFKGPRVGRGDVVPVQESDYIFSVAGEELGFIGCVLIILLITFLLFRTVHIAKNSCDVLGRYMCFGFFGMIFFQTAFNLGMCLCLFPVMGVTLPFFSAGGSSAACLYFALGLVQNVYMRREDKDLMILNSQKV